MHECPELSWGMFPVLLLPPKLYEALNCTLCGLNPNLMRYNILKDYFK